MEIATILENRSLQASAPCRFDMGGTLDIGTFYYPLHPFLPSTFNAAIDLRTEVTLTPYKRGWVKVSSRGFSAQRFRPGQADYTQPLGLMFAVVDYFGAHGVHVHIESASPPRSALGGSSAAVVALTAALAQLEVLQGRRELSRRQIALLAHALEAAMAGVACGAQDQLAATYGGVNAWYWNGIGNRRPFSRKMLLTKRRHAAFKRHLLLAYGGSTHTSADINGRWVRDFLRARRREVWLQIIDLTGEFMRALVARDFSKAVAAMQAETALRRSITPDVLDETGKDLVRAASDCRCGARFTGAGGGGCLWALGEIDDIEQLRSQWKAVLSPCPEARLLDFNIDAAGLTVN